MFCGKCGREVSDTAKFCPGCGAPVRSNHRSQASPQADEASHAEDAEAAYRNTASTPTPERHAAAPQSSYRQPGAPPHTCDSGHSEESGTLTTDTPASKTTATLTRNPAIMIGIAVAALCFLALCVVFGGTGGNQPASLAGGADKAVANFTIEGKWRNVGDDTYGQIQHGSIVVFDGTHCNVVSPADTYAITRSGF